jgi:hypothetical protein
MKGVLIALCSLAIFQGSLRAENETESSPLNIFGFIQIQTQQSFHPSDAARFNVLLRRIRIGIEGKITQRLSFFMLSEGGYSAPSQPYHLSILDAWIKYTISDLLQFRFGQDWYKFGWEYSQPIPTLPFIQFAEIEIGLLDTMGRNGYYGYDLGLWISGDRKQSSLDFGYSLGFTNGTGLNKSEDNSKKDVSARLYFSPARRFFIGGSLFRGSSRISETDVGETIIGLESHYEGSRLLLAGEYFYAQYQKGESSQNRIPEEIKKGFYICAAYAIRELRILCRFEAHRGVIDSSGYTATVTLGLNYVLSKMNMLRVNYFHKWGPGVMKNERDQVIIQMQVFFGEF